MRNDKRDCLFVFTTKKIAESQFDGFTMSEAFFANEVNGSIIVHALFRMSRWGSRCSRLCVRFYTIQGCNVDNALNGIQTKCLLFRTNNCDTRNRTRFLVTIEKKKSGSYVSDKKIDVFVWIDRFENIVLIDLAQYRCPAHYIADVTLAVKTCPYSRRSIVYMRFYALRVPIRVQTSSQRVAEEPDPRVYPGVSQTSRPFLPSVSSLVQHSSTLLAFYSFRLPISGRSLRPSIRPLIEPLPGGVKRWKFSRRELSQLACEHEEVRSGRIVFYGDEKSSY